MQPLGKAIPSNPHGMTPPSPPLRHCLWAMHAHKFAQSAMSEANGELTHVAATNLISYLLPKQRLPPEQKRLPPSQACPSFTLLHAVGSSSRQQQSSRFRASPLAIWPFGQTFVCHRQRGVHFVYILPKNAESSLCSLLASLLGRMINSPSSRQAPHSLSLSLRLSSRQALSLVNKEYTQMILGSSALAWLGN